MQLHTLFTDDRAVSPVIGVILMVAITMSPASADRVVIEPACAMVPLNSFHAGRAHVR